MSASKQVILRVTESELNCQDPYEFVRFYFIKFPSNASSDSSRHFIHYQPPSDIPGAKVHIVIDLETPDFAGTLAEPPS
ncbi:uncharacterized protein BDW47DRAFT_112109 [Aspergillus candidus]|uniref:Uncharacterized protein n=1 Tax=Aspergillus candidus TaxID=41067 RepID=A0A2I2F1Q2_ASPCN|nr:hypothetical protein BDW47DRAFT_112109 [Aspergillus candidus]PLB34560.1 hypothetical protein BDW47DRAFT_112109 [Aspergillus candidus]